MIAQKARDYKPHEGKWTALNDFVIFSHGKTKCEELPQDLHGPNTEQCATYENGKSDTPQGPQSPSCRVIPDWWWMGKSKVNVEKRDCDVNKLYSSCLPSGQYNVHDLEMWYLALLRATQNKLVVARGKSIVFGEIGIRVLRAPDV